MKFFTIALMAVSGTLTMGNNAWAGCWSANDAGDNGAKVEICFKGTCEQTYLTSECADISGAAISYKSGWYIETQITENSVTDVISLNGVILSQAELAHLSCKDLDDEQGCRFAAVSTEDQELTDALLSEVPTPNSDMAKIEGYFTSALEVDALGLQISLLEAGLYTGKVTGEWGEPTQTAFEDGLDWANSRGLSYDLNSDQGFYSFVWDLRTALFDEDSGLKQIPEGNEFLLIAASKRSDKKASNMAQQLENDLSQRGFPNLTKVLVTKKGGYAVVVGMYSQNGCEARLQQFVEAGLVPIDSRCANVGRFDPMNWAD